MEIRKLKQVEEIANKHFACGVSPVQELHAKGYRGVKLIVGWKKNEAYDPSIDPQNPPVELLTNKELLANKLNPRKPDVRIIWINPGMTEEELLEKYILPIEKDLKKMIAPSPVDRTVTKINVKSDADIAAEVASGKKQDSRFDEFDDGYEDSEFSEDDDFGGIAGTDDEDGINENSDNNQKESDPAVEQSGNKEILEAIGQLAENIGVVSEDLGRLNQRIDLIDTRLNEVEGEPAKKDAKKPAKKANRPNKKESIPDDPE